MAETTAPPSFRRNAISYRAETQFRTRLAELGVSLVESAWLGAEQPHAALCSAGHACRPVPRQVAKGRRVCRRCPTEAAVQRRRAALEEFRWALAKVGAVLLEPDYLGAHQPHRVRCREGHDCNPAPHEVKRGQGVCLVCVRKSPAVAETEFRSRLAELGVTLLESDWRGHDQRYRAVCSDGHVCYPRPTNVQQGQGACPGCSRRDPDIVWAEFRAAVMAQGGVVLAEQWLGSRAPHRVRCPRKHESWAVPASVRRGFGICRRCAGRTWDVFYVVRNGAVDIVKFGITSGDPRPRLNDHAADGFTEIVRLHKSLPDDAAPALERFTLSALAAAGEEPVRGREYFPGSTLPLILGLIDHHPAASGTSPGALGG